MPEWVRRDSHARASLHIDKAVRDSSERVAAIAYLCKALAELAARPDLELSYPVHLNPNVQGSVLPGLSGIDNLEGR